MLERRDYAESIWGNLDQVAESENNPKYLVRRIKEENAEFPEVYIACGEQDSLRDVNLDMYHFLKENGVNAVYESGAGAHEWDFWDTYIKRAMEWLPTENTAVSYTHLDVYKRQDVDTLRQLISQSIPQVVNSAVTIVITFTSMIVLDIPMTLLTLVMVGIMMVTTKKLSGKSGKYFGEQQRNLGRVNGYIEEDVYKRQPLEERCKGGRTDV